MVSPFALAACPFLGVSANLAVHDPVLTWGKFSGTGKLFRRDGGRRVEAHARFAEGRSAMIHSDLRPGCARPRPRKQPAPAGPCRPDRLNMAV